MSALKARLSFYKFLGPIAWDPISDKYVIFPVILTSEPLFSMKTVLIKKKAKNKQKNKLNSNLEQGG